VLKKEMPAMRMAATRSGHIQPDNGLVTAGQTQYRVPMQPSLDGNTVDAQLEYGNFASNSLEYQTSLRFLNGKIKGLMLAIKGQ
jgi:flagellar basal-body rod protein FlgB